MYTYIFIYIYVYIYTYTYTYMYIRLYLFDSYDDIYVYMYIYVYIYTYICTYIHIHTQLKKELHELRLQVVSLETRTRILRQEEETACCKLTELRDQKKLLEEERERRANENSRLVDVLEGQVHTYIFVCIWICVCIYI